MADDPAAAFKAVFADFRLVKTRNAAQLIFEVEIEAADAALAALGGLPKSHSGIWCAIALLDPKAASAPRKPPSAAAPREPTLFRDMPTVKQAAILCNDEVFREFIATRDGNAGTYSADRVAMIVRTICGVGSRADIVEGAHSGRTWQKLHSEFLSWKHDAPLAEPTR